ncbi:MAG: DNRLRE domain-containing protein, partial [Actinobacteria bacterium]|nr:DNRLRE domain-containing protein [Actinomycetota bacterium]
MFSRIRGSVRFGSLVASLTVVAGLLTPGVPASAEEPPVPGITLPAPVPGVFPPPPLTADEREPVVAPSDPGPAETPLEVPSASVVEEAAESGEGLTPVNEYASSLDTASGGDHVALISAQPQNFRAQNGSWQRIHHSLHPVTGGFQTGVGPVQVFFPATLSAASGITFGHGGVSIALRLGSGSSTAQFDGDSTITYPNVADQTDLRVVATATGYEETLILRGAPSTNSFRWQIDAHGATLQVDEDGDLGVYFGGRQVATVPHPVVYDSATTGVRERAPGFDFALSQSAGTYQLDVVYETDWLADPARVFPVLVDPSPQVQDLDPSRDTFASACSGEQDTNYANDPELQVGFTNECNHVAFIDFFAGDYARPDRVLQAGNLWMGKTYTSNANDPVQVKWIATQAWNVENVTWNNKPSVETPLHDWATKAWAAGDFNYWNLTALYQDMIEGDRTDNGVRLDAINHHIFASKNSPAPPFLELVYNDLPPAPTLTTSLPDGATVKTPSPLLAVTGFPTDLNGDDVQVQFEIAENTTFTGSSVIRSPWLDSKSWAVDAGRLKDGVTYYWRAVSGDVCGEGICTNVDGAGGSHPRNASAYKSFQVSLPHYGASDQWAMWFQSLGNGMELQVNQSNGNLVLDYPLDALATPIGPLAISLSYNSQMPDDVGLGAGWNVTAGPLSDQMDMPSRLLRDNVAQGSGVKLINYDGGVMHFTKEGEASVYSSGAGTISEDPAATGTAVKWTYTTPSGGLYVFDGNGNLVAARSSSAAPGQPGFTYG